MKMELLRAAAFRSAAILLLQSLISSTDAYDALDPIGNITIKWDIKWWTDDGYTANITIVNFQQYRPIREPGWSVGWTWAENEVIWGALGSETKDQGDCSRFKGKNIPHCCKKSPTVVDLLPGTPYNQRFPNCCKGGVIDSWAQDPTNAVSSFLLSVGSAGNNETSVRMPKNFTFMGPGPGYTCGPAATVKPTRFVMPDGRRVEQAMKTWTVDCTYSPFVAQQTPTCCVSLSAFYSETIITCPSCTCGCQNNLTHPCVTSNSPNPASVVSDRGNSNNLAPLVQCTDHMCPIRVHWHVKANYREYWRVKVTITNFNTRMNYTHWNLVAQHPNFDNVKGIFSFNYKLLDMYRDHTAMLYGVKLYNDVLSQAADQVGNVQSEILFGKDREQFTFNQGWAFPRRIHFNGDNCVLPPPDAYPRLPNSGIRQNISNFILMCIVVSLFLFLC